MRNEPIAVRRALISVYDKVGVVDFARGLSKLDIAIISSGGTARALRDAGVPVTEVESVTGAPEMLGGRVKTLHPNIHGGILALRSSPDHMAELAAHSIDPIDLVVTNLYPFHDVASRAESSEDEIIEMIDVGGPTMIRAAAKNYSDVCVVTDSAEYPEILAELEENNTTISYATRKDCALRAFDVTLRYEVGISAWMHRDEDFPDPLVWVLDRDSTLRYGENPHQAGALYFDAVSPTGSQLQSAPDLADSKAQVTSWLKQATRHGGKELSFNNIWDAEAAWRLVGEFAENLGDAAVVIVKHAIPCGVALADSPQAAYERALAGDPTSAFGGVIAFNTPLDEATAKAVNKTFFEVVIAPGFTDAALREFGTKENLRVLEAPQKWIAGKWDAKRLARGFIVQNMDNVSVEDWEVAGIVTPTDAQWQDLQFAWRICAHVRSNAIVIAKDGQALGIGSGQQSRVDAADIAVTKADGRAAGGGAASDAFFPFADGLEAIAKAGVGAVVAPRGSKRDSEVAQAADGLGIALVWTKERHFRH